jgi:hypothetical protein
MRQLKAHHIVTYLSTYVHSYHISLPNELIRNYHISLTCLDPCEDVRCSFNSLCVVDSNYRASCQCPKCPPTTKPVCGSDGKTYVNECELRKQSCTTKTNIRVLHEGKCSKFIKY